MSLFGRLHVRAQRRRPDMQRGRRGLTVLFVLQLLTAALALSYSLMWSQSNGSAIQRNSALTHRARSAAMSGLAVAIREMHLTDSWGGSSSSFSGMLSDGDGYSVTYAPGDPTLTSLHPDWSDYPYRVTINVDGYALDAPFSSGSATHQVRAVMRLVPVKTVNEPSGWNLMQSHTVAQSNNKEFRVEVPARIEGSVYTQGDVYIAELAPNTSNSRNRYLKDLPVNYRTFSRILITDATNASPIVITTASPHGLTTGAQVVITGVGGNTNANSTWSVLYVSGTKFSLSGSSGNANYTSGGTVATFFLRSTSNNTSNAKQRLNLLEINTANGSLIEMSSAAGFSSGFTKPASLTTYRIYAGGPVYTIPTLGSSLQNVAMQPDPLTNPLGFFYRSGDLELQNNVTIQGTVFCTNDLRITGTNVNLNPVNLPPLHGATTPIRLELATCDDFRLDDTASGASLTGFLAVFDKFEVEKSPYARSLAITGRVAVLNEFQIFERQPWETQDWSLLWTLFTAQILVQNNFVAFLSTVGLNSAPNITIKADPSPVTYHWKDATASTPIYEPGTNEVGLYWWDVLEVVENP